MGTSGFLKEGGGKPSLTPAEHEARKTEFIRAIYGQESGHGAADTSFVNSQGVTGPMQVEFATFQGMKKNGQIPAHADFSNPNHTKRAGEILAGQLFDDYGGDTKLAAAAYYGGPKAVRNGRVVEFGNRERPEDPTTSRYARDIAERMKGR
jgi:soluble lytic murein transglycosylase-like protein